MKALNFPDEEGKFAYILDGQHRLEGFKHSDGIEFDLLADKEPVDLDLALASP